MYARSSTVPPPALVHARKKKEKERAKKEKERDGGTYEYSKENKCDAFAMTCLRCRGKL